MNKPQNQNVFLTFSRHKMELLALLGLFTDQNDRFPYFTWNLKRYPLQAEPPCIGHYKEYALTSPKDIQVLYK